MVHETLLCGHAEVLALLTENGRMTPDTPQAESPTTHKASLAEVIRTYEEMHGVSLSQIGKAATQLGFMRKLEADLRGALIDGQPIRNWSTYVLDTLQSQSQSHAVTSPHRT